MDELHRILIENQSIVFILTSLWVILGFGFLLWRRQQKGLNIPKTNDPDVVFVERFASGCSHKSWITKVGGAAKCLTVIVTESHFVVTSFFPFTAIVGIYDLEHSVPISNVVEIVYKAKVTEIKFKRTDGTTCKLTLRLKDPAGFEEALQNGLIV